MSLADEFLNWARDPLRSDDELYTIELLVEEGWKAWCRKHKRPDAFDLPAIRAHHDKQRLNPAYRASIPSEKLDALLETWESLISLTLHNFETRPITDLEAFRFFPHFRQLDLYCRLQNITGLAGLRSLQKLALSEHDLSEILDFSPLAGLPDLTNLNLSLKTAWPDLSTLATLPSLKRFQFTGNLLALEGIPSLPRLIEAKLNAGFHWKTPLRDLSRLPAMPEVRLLKIEAANRLDGIDRFPCINLELAGPFTDLTPLAHHPSLTWLRLEGERFQDLTPISTIPALRELRLDRKRPLDVASLAESASLREVCAPHCPIISTELATVNALLPPWSDDFALPDPGTHAGPPPYFHIDQSAPDAKTERPRAPDPRVSLYQDDPAYAGAEAKWFRREFYRRMRALLGDGWKEETLAESDYWFSHDRPGSVFVNLTRYRDVLRLPEVVAVAWEMIRSARFAWHIFISIETEEDFDGPQADTRSSDTGDFDPEQERANWEAGRQSARREQAFLEREHQLHLQRELGNEITPDAFAPPPEEIDDCDDTLEPAEPELTILFSLWLNKSGLWAASSQHELVAEFYHREPEDWHALSAPPEERPDWR